MEYDHAQRPIRNFQSINGGPSVLTSELSYNELRKLVEKKLHLQDNSASFPQSVDFSYNIRNWLTHINDRRLEDKYPEENNNDDENDFFGMELFYETGYLALQGNQQFNGNISAVLWRVNDRTRTMER